MTRATFIINLIEQHRYLLIVMEANSTGSYYWLPLKSTWTLYKKGCKKKNDMLPTCHMSNNLFSRHSSGKLVMKERPYWKKTKLKKSVVDLIRFFYLWKASWSLLNDGNFWDWFLVLILIQDPQHYNDFIIFKKRRQSLTISSLNDKCGMNTNFKY